MKHTIHANQCINCGKGMKLANSGRTRLTNLCLGCMSNKDSLPEHFFCKAISKSTKKRCRKITMEDYCVQHRGKSE